MTKEQRRGPDGRIMPVREDTETERYCPDCDEMLPRSAFYNEKRAKSGLTRRCKAHHAAMSYASRQKRYRHILEMNLWKNHRVRLDWWDARLIAQSGRCASCGDPMVNPHVDHCHVTEVRRGLLCPPCNQGLGNFKDSVERLEAAIAYLRSCEGAPLGVR